MMFIRRLSKVFFITIVFSMVAIKISAADVVDDQVIQKSSPTELPLAQPAVNPKNTESMDINVVSQQQSFANHIQPLQENSLSGAVGEKQVSAGAPPSTSESLAKVTLTLIFIVSLILAFGWIMRRVNVSGVATQHGINILSVSALGSREKAVLIEVQGQKLLLGVAPGRVNTLHILPVDVNSDTSKTVLKDTSEVKSTVETRSHSSFAKYMANLLQAGVVREDK